MQVVPWPLPRGNRRRTGVVRQSQSARLRPPTRGGGEAASGGRLDGRSDRRRTPSKRVED